MNKVWILPAQENWICDRMCEEFNRNNLDIIVANPYMADVIWLLSDWRWRDVDPALLNKKVITTVHHIVPEKFGKQEQFDFQLRDKITNVYHVFNEKTQNFISQLTTKPIELVPYWANQNIWFKSLSEEFREKHRQMLGIAKDAFVIGSFQRDTEGSDLKSPKLEKGPDLFVDFVNEANSKEYLIRMEEQFQKSFSHVHVLLSGWRRHYVLNRLQQLGIKHSYVELPAQNRINVLYQLCDLYAVTARYEGGPQALLETGLVGVPTVSRDVGIASQVLPPEAISTNVLDAKPAIPNVSKMLIPEAFKPYREMIAKL